MVQQTANPKIITGNDLLSGEVVYLSHTGNWACWHYEAAPFATADVAEAKLAEIMAQDTSVVGPYVAEATLDSRNIAAPVHFRDVFRATGPTNRALGKQVLEPQNV